MRRKRKIEGRAGARFLMCALAAALCMAGMRAAQGSAVYAAEEWEETEIWESEWEETEIWEGEETGSQEDVWTETEWTEEWIETEWTEAQTPPGTENLPQTELTPGTEDLPQTEPAPGTEDLPQTELPPGTENLPQTELPPGMEDLPQTELTPGTEDLPQTEPAPGGETETDTAAETGTESENRLPVLANASGDLEAEIFAGEGDGFPEGSMLHILTAEDIIEDGEDKEQRCREWEQTMQKDYALSEEEEQQVQDFLLFYLLVTDAEGKEVELSSKAEVRLLIRQDPFYQSLQAQISRCRAGCHFKGAEFQELTETRLLLDEEEKTAQICFSADTLGWFSVLRLENAAQEETPEAEELQVGLETIAAVTPLGSTGSPVTSGGSGFVLMSPETIDPAFRPVKWYGGRSSVEPFSQAGSNVQFIDETRGTHHYVGYYPRNKNAKGKFGAIYHNVLFRDGEYYDMKMTVVNYTDKTWTGAGKVEHAAYPPILFNDTHIAWWTLQRVGEVVIKVEFFKNGDASQTPVRQNIRLQWYDIDAYQRFGIRAGDGAISQKYYQTADSIVYYSREASKADTANEYLYLTAARSLGSGNILGNVGFALEDCSTYYISFGYLDHLKDGESTAFSPLTGRTTAKRLEQMLESLEKGDGSLKRSDGTQTSYDELIQTDLEAPIPLDPSYPRKYVSNDGSSWEEANELPAVDGTYYYKLTQYVPEQQPQYAYSRFEITDELEAGVDYVGNLTVRCTETGADATGLFQVSASDDRIVLVPKNPADASFMGYHFEFVFQVKMDSGEISPATEDGAFTYTVKNKARLEAALNNSSSVFSSESNTVTTTARRGPVYAKILLSKEIDTADIVWAHGNPTFTFALTGEDILGQTHAYYDTVEFTPQNVGNGATAVLTAEFSVMAGWYKAAEEATARYRLNSIHSVTSGTVSGAEVAFDVSGGETGQAVFYNIKTTDQDESHTAFVRNTVKQG